LNPRLVTWLAIVLLSSGLAYASRAVSGKPDDDVLYHYSIAVGGVFQYGLMLGIVLLLTMGLNRRDVLALRRPRSWWRAVGLALLVVVAVFVFEAVLDPFLNAGDEQGYAPNRWEPSHADAYAANFVVIALIGPIVEELMFRGVGYSLLARYGSAVAIAVVGITFGLVHGLVYGFVILAAFGAGLAWLRAKTGSLYPCVAVHATFNAVALVVAVTT
jgi:membrane protease YdiL (CAAX protease family)